MTRGESTVAFTYQEVRSALRLYFEPLLWVRQALLWRPEGTSFASSHLKSSESKGALLGVPDLDVASEIRAATALRLAATTRREDTSTRQEPVAIEVPVVVHGPRLVEGRAVIFFERTTTVLVFDSGAVIRLSSALAPGQLLSLTDERAKMQIVCEVVKSETAAPEMAYVELRFVRPTAGFWASHLAGAKPETQGNATALSSELPEGGSPASGMAVREESETIRVHSQEATAKSRRFVPRTRSVRNDWRAWLPHEKEKVFSACVKRLESLYVMFSVSLNEALMLLHAGRTHMAYSAIGVTSPLCLLLVERLESLLTTLAEHAKHHGGDPTVAPLDPANFKGGRYQRAARMSGLLFRVLLSDRLQFLYKVSTLVEMVEDLGKDFQATADRLASGSSKQIDADWEELNAVHYDLNTCLRESNVVLKSFLLVLPDNQVSVLDAEIGRSWQRKLGSDLNDSSLLTADEIAYSREGL